jgi:hypothetical protein
MGTTRRIPIEQWKQYFDDFTSRQLMEEGPNAATIEVLSPRLGDQFPAMSARCHALAYDPRSGAFEVLLEDFDHVVDSPVEIWVIEEEERQGFVSTLDVICADGTQEIIYLRRSGPLPATSSRANAAD